MNSVVNFLIESGISLSLLSLVYIVLLRKETFFRVNRLFLLASIIFSVLLPFLKFRVYEPQTVLLSEITVTPYRNMMEAVTIYGQDLSAGFEHIILSTNFIIFIYSIGFVFFFARFMFRIGQIIFTIVKNKVVKQAGYKLVELQPEISPYSFLNYVFISNQLKETEGYDKMVIHELEHIRQGHSFDIVFLEILSVFQWFNPFIWMLKRAIKENHEYLADQAVLTSGISKGKYKSLLLNQFMGGQIVIANSFNTSLIKNRIKMMSKIRSHKLANLKLLFGLVIAIGLIVVFACEQKQSADMLSENIPQQKGLIITTVEGKTKITGDIDGLQKLKKIIELGERSVITDNTNEGYLLIHEKEAELNNEPDEVFNIVEEMPVFPGGQEALRKFISASLKYPKEAIEKGKQGKVYVTFVVGKDGQIMRSKIARGVDPAMDKEAIRVINNLPKWKPGKQGGKAVNVSYTVPINFTLQ